MNDASQIDDRRRFKVLWKEMVFARIIPAALAAGPTVPALRLFGVYAGGPENHILASSILAGLIALPCVAAKRGKLVLPTTWAAVAAGMGLLILLEELSVSDVWTPMPAYATAAVALGVVEGILERSAATVYCGLMCGLLTGTLAGYVWWPPFSGGWGDTAAFCFSAVMLHLGIGLSLALGRWIRDLPKRKAGVDPAAGEG